MADSDGKMLMEKVQLRILNSTKELLAAGARCAKTRSALVVGNPKFDLTAAQQTKRDCGVAAAERRVLRRAGRNRRRLRLLSAPISNAGAAQFASRGGDLKGGDLNPLPGTQVEVDAVDKLLKKAGWQATEYTGELALKDTMTQVQGPRVVHIATHGFFLSDEELTADCRGARRKSECE